MMGQQKQQTMKKAVKKGVGPLFLRRLWLARGTSTVLGLALVMTLIVGVASALVSAPAEAAPASTLKAGVQNAVNAVTSMVGSVAGPILKLDNNGTGTALDLQVESGKAPMTVNSETKVDNLNADKVDGKSADEIGVNGVERVHAVSAYNSNSYKTAIAYCPVGKEPIGTGSGTFGAKHGSFPDQESDVAITLEAPYAYSVVVEAYEVEPTDLNWSVSAYAFCANLP